MELEAQFALERQSLLLSQKQHMLVLEREHIEALIRRHTEGLSYVEYEMLDEQIKYLENAMYHLGESFVMAKQLLASQQKAIAIAIKNESENA